VLERQKSERGFTSGGYIVTNPNCSTIVMALALAPLHAKFGIESVIATTLQAVSGAGYPGVPSLDVVDNVIPFIDSEERKMETEPRKILGRLGISSFENAPFTVSAQCHRVNVSDGHMVRPSGTEAAHRAQTPLPRARRKGPAAAAPGSRRGRRHERHRRTTFPGQRDGLPLRRAGAQHGSRRGRRGDSERGIAARARPAGRKILA
jgi:hypothetical protein